MGPLQLQYSFQNSQFALIEAYLAGETADWDIGNALGATMELHFYDRFAHRWSTDMQNENGTSISGLTWANHTIKLRDRQNVDAMRLTLSGEEPALAAVLGSFTFNVTFTHTATEFSFTPAELTLMPWQCADNDTVATRFGDCASYYPGVESCPDDQWPNATEREQLNLTQWHIDHNCDRLNHDFCAVDNQTETLEHCYTGAGENYRGELSVTVSGLECQRWDDQSPHAHNISLNESAHGVGAHNFCRNPDTDEGKRYNMTAPWCFTNVNATSNGTVDPAERCVAADAQESCLVRNWLGSVPVEVTDVSVQVGCPVACSRQDTCEMVVQANATPDNDLYSRDHDVPLSTFVAQYEATAAGDYSLDLMLRGKVWRASPVTIGPAVVEPAVCTIEADRTVAPLVYWLGHDGSIPKTVFIADDTTQFAAAARDRFSNRLLGGGTDLSGNAEHVAFDKGSLHTYLDYNEPAEVTDFGDGTYTLTFNATVAGKYSVAVLVNELHIARSPFELNILPAKTSAETSVVKRTLGGDVVQAGTQVSVSIWVYDIFGNFRATGGDGISVRVECQGGWWENPKIFCEPRLDDVPLQVFDFADGTYGGMGIVTLVGNYSMNVFLDGECVDLPGELSNDTWTDDGMWGGCDVYAGTAPTVTGAGGGLRSVFNERITVSH